MLLDTRIFKFSFAFLFILLTFNNMTQAKELVIGFTYDIPPYITKDAGGGMEIDIVRQALKVKGHTFSVKQYSYEQLDHVIKKDGLDAAACVQKSDDGTYYSDNFIWFKNYAFTKKGSGIKIDSISDLKGKSIVAWENAYEDLGPDFEALFSPDVKEPYRDKYKEIPNQKNQVEMFWNGEADVIVIDESILLWFTKHSSTKNAKVSNIVYHNIFGDKTEFRVSFKDKQMRDDFNAGLKHIREKGVYQKIMDKYLK